MERKTKKDFSIEHILSHGTATEADDDEGSASSSSSTSGDEDDFNNSPQLMSSSSTNNGTPFINPWLQDYGTATYFGRNGWPIHSIRPPFFTLQGIHSLIVLSINYLT